MKLESLSNYIEHLERSIPTELNTAPMKECDRLFVKRVITYQRFLKQPLTLGMFVPCSLNGEVINGKPLSPAKDIEWDAWEVREADYRQAQKRVLFKGFNHVYKNTYSVILYKDKEFIEGLFFSVKENIEGLLSLNVELTPNAIKQLQ